MSQVNPIDHFHGKMKKALQRFIRKTVRMDKVTAFLLPPVEDDLGAPEQQARSAILFGGWLVVLVFGVLGLWSILAPLDSAAVAPGHVVVNSNRKTVSHYEGGIVDEIMVSDGQLVEAGAPLVRLRGVQAKAQVQLLNTQNLNNLAIAARLIAERDGAEDITFPPEILEQKDDAEIAKIISGQKSIFRSRVDNIKGQLDVLETRISQHEQEITGLKTQEQSTTQQIHFLNEQITPVAELVESGYAARAELLQLKRQVAELSGRQGEYIAGQAKARDSINEARLSMLNLKNDYMSKVLEELKQTQQAIAETEEKITASSDVLNRVVIRAPERGIVNDLKTHTVDGVVRPGEKILDLIPVDDKLIIEARVSPQDIDVVRADLPARVRLTAYKAREVPVLDGKVIFVSADQMVDERTGGSYFLSRIEIDPSELGELKRIALYPGMPADALILTGSHTFFTYLMDPITHSFNQAFRQQ